MTLTPQWGLSWRELHWEEPFPTPEDGYCHLTLDGYRLHLGPVEIRYSLSD